VPGGVVFLHLPQAAAQLPAWNTAAGRLGQPGQAQSLVAPSIFNSAADTFPRQKIVRHEQAAVGEDSLAHPVCGDSKQN
jgi:hypothetical protein